MQNAAARLAEAYRKIPQAYIAHVEYLEIVMEPMHPRMEHQHADRRHLADLALEAVWTADDESHLDADHARALSMLGFGFSGGRFPDSVH